MTNSKIFLLVLLLIVVLIAGIFIVSKRTSLKTSVPAITSQIPTLTIKKTSIETNAIHITEQGGFTPQTIKVKAGTRVIWINKVNKTVSVNSDNHPTHLLYPPLNLGRLIKDSSVQIIFEKTGVYKYHNHYAPSQKGIIIVE